MFSILSSAAGVGALLLGGAGVHLHADAETSARTTMTSNNCRTIASFDSSSQNARWRAVNDSVMGGRSSGGPRFSGGQLVFSGNTNTNGGGFSSVRALLSRGAISGAATIRMRVRSDNRSYQLTMQTNARSQGVPIAYRAPINVRAGSWQTVDVRLSSLRPTIFGQNVSAPAFDAASARTIGFIVDDKRDGAFSLAVDWIQACPAGS